MKGLKTVTIAYVLTLLLLATFISQSRSTPKGSFQRRNWTPQAMLYLKGTQGRRFISEDRKEGDVYDTLHLETRSHNTEKLTVDQAAAVLLNFLQQAREGGESRIWTYGFYIHVFQMYVFHALSITRCHDGHFSCF
uniref:spexin prohormone 1 isoform X1 n=1 Tax=Maylandia zebra TaxID=106582 RepID=UPI000D320957|nr:spexin isoform X1 [Maylandia zebra]